MENEPYKNREIDAMFTSLRAELLDDKLGILPRIEKQTTKTNGRVNRLERGFLVIAVVVATLLVTSNNEIAKVIIALI